MALALCRLSTIHLHLCQVSRAPPEAVMPCKLQYFQALDLLEAVCGFEYGARMLLKAMKRNADDERQARSHCPEYLLRGQQGIPADKGRKQGPGDGTKPRRCRK